MDPTEKEYIIGLISNISDPFKNVKEQFENRKNEWKIEKNLLKEKLQSEKRKMACDKLSLKFLRFLIEYEPTHIFVPYKLTGGENIFTYYKQKIEKVEEYISETEDLEDSDVFRKKNSEILNIQRNNEI